jgi:uncharacterized protein YbjT (DUF2867 family)
MRVILFGATGMIGQGVLRECLLDSEVERVLAIGRSATGQKDTKLQEIVHNDFSDFSAVAGEMTGFDACFFCLGVSAMGLTEADYERVTFGYAVTAAETLVKLNPRMTFEYISGAGTDSTEQGRAMWARVKGRTENALLRMPFKDVYMLRPGYIQPMHGIRSKTGWYQAMYTVMSPLYPVLKRVAPNYVTTTAQLGRAMIGVAKRGAENRVLEVRDINELGKE